MGKYIGIENCQAPTFPVLSILRTILTNGGCNKNRRGEANCGSVDSAAVTVLHGHRVLTSFQDAG